MKVKNINGTSKNTCRCGSWLSHWKKFSGQSPNYCPAIGCMRTDLVGAHVQKGGWDLDQNWYICPLCNEHNQHQGELDLSEIYRLVSANVSETCG
jgi:hypothetical protein